MKIWRDVREWLFRWSRLMALTLLVGCGSQPARAENRDLPENAPRRTPEPHLTMGMNLAGISDWTREWVFVDVFKHARPWISQDVGDDGPWDNKRPLRTTAEGWPILAKGQAAAALMCRELEGHYPAGVYICTYKGDGDIAFGHDAEEIQHVGNRVELQVTPADGGIFLKIERSNPKNPVRDIHVWMPGFENAKSTFHPLFVQRLKPFKVLRFMDWGATNDSELRYWRDRTTPLHASQHRETGLAVEYMIELCNELKANPWFCMPHRADDEFVREFATLVRDRLHPDATIYVEWSNEAWNGIFDQAKWVFEEAEKRKLEWPLVIADEAGRDFRIWRKVFAGRENRLARVAAGHHYNPWAAEKILERLDGDFDAVSCAAYFHARDEDIKRFRKSTTAQEVLRSARKNLTEKAIPLLRDHAELADRWSAKLNRRIAFLAYEGGQHITAWGEEIPYEKAYFEVQTLPGMADAYKELLTGFRASGGDVFMAFNYVGRQGEFGSWGHLQYQDEPLEKAPKFRALLHFARE